MTWNIFGIFQKYSKNIPNQVNHICSVCEICLTYSNHILKQIQIYLKYVLYDTLNYKFNITPNNSTIFDRTG
jgi:hypothetical protein